MWTLLFPLLAFAQDAPATGTLVIDARQPAEVYIDGASFAQLFQPGQLTLEVPTGAHVLKVFVNGSPTEQEIQIGGDAETQVLVGKNGLSVGQTDIETEEAQGPVELQVRVGGDEDIRIVLDGERLQIGVGEQRSVDLEPGRHRMALQNSTGTVIWASGVLHMKGPDPVIVLVSSGRMPEVSGQGRFTSGG